MSQAPRPMAPQQLDLESGAGLGLERADEAALLLRGRALPQEPGVWDELREAAGGLRAPWRRFAQWLPPAQQGSDIGADFDRRVVQVAQQIRRDGVTHNVFSDEGAKPRVWSLELLPLIIDAADWAAIQDGVTQRAQLLEAMLDDLYGPQRLLHEGLLPPALLHRHPGWLPPMRGARVAGGQRLHIVAFDIARGADGRWWIVAQRTQGPSGLGYVLHNRLVISRQFSEPFRELRVQHIASSYRRLLDTVDAAASEIAGGHNPRLVLLTPGPYSETYFEHAYLARYLGVPLVEGGDLTVRGERLFMRTVEGLEPVHGVLRRLDDDWCDPLELRPDSTLGVPGLVQAARAGNVVLANALGTAFLESPAIKGFLPAIAERLLGQTLRMPATPTWWCGEAAAWADVRGALDGKLVRSTFPHEGRTSQVRQLAIREIETDPDAWTVQGRLRFSRAPIWGAGALTPRPALVRVFAISDADGGWHVLPGGMTRVSQREDASVSMQRGGTSLDTWVLTDGPVDTFSMLPKRLSVEDIAERARPLASRTGENLFWLGRYSERTEQQVRAARALLVTIDTDSESNEPVLQALSTVAERCGLVPFGVPGLVQAAPLFERVLLQGLADVNGSSVAFNLAALSRASQALRERLSSEQWGLIRQMAEGFARELEAPAGDRPTLHQALSALDRLALNLAAMTGMQSDRMTRDHGWRLLTVGRLLERLQGLTMRLQCFLEARALASAAGIDLLLELFDSTITFRARYQRHEDLLALTDLLVLDTTNPRATAGVLRRLRTELRKLPGGPAVTEELLSLLPAEGSGLVLQSLSGASDAQIGEQLLAVCVRLQQAAGTISDRIGERYFTLAHGGVQSV